MTQKWDSPGEKIQGEGKGRRAWARLKAGEKIWRAVDSFTRGILGNNTQVQVLIKLLMLVDEMAWEHTVPSRTRAQGDLSGQGTAPPRGQVIGRKWAGFQSPAP